MIKDLYTWPGSPWWTRPKIRQYVTTGGLVRLALVAVMIATPEWALNSSSETEYRRLNCESAYKKLELKTKKG